MPTMEELMLGGAAPKPETLKPASSMESMMLGTPEAPVAPKPDESAIGRKAKATGFGASSAITGASSGITRLFGLSQQAIAAGQGALQKKMLDTFVDDPRILAAGEEFIAANASNAKKITQHADRIDEYWDEKLAGLYPEDPTFADKVAIGVGDLAMAPVSYNPAVGLPITYSRMFEEGYQYSKEKGDGEKDSIAKALVYAGAATPLEYAMDKFMISKFGATGLKGLSGGELLRVGGKNLLGLLRKQGLSGTGEAMTEVMQEGINRKLNGETFFHAGTWETAGISAIVGGVGGTAGNVSGMMQTAEISNDMRKAGVPKLAIDAVVNDLGKGDIASAQTILDNYGADLTASAMAEQLNDPTLDKATAEYKAGAKMLGNLALKKQGIQLLSEMDNIETGTLQKMAADLGYDGTGALEDVKGFIYENRNKLPGYQTKVQKELLTTIAESDATAFQKQAYKWMAQGDVELQDVGMVRAIFAAEAKKAGYEDVDAYFEENQGTFMAPGRDAIDMYQANAFHGGRGADGKPFQNFDLSYSGTGEGAAAFGHGVYLTERFGIGKGYAKALDGRSRRRATVKEGKSSDDVERLSFLMDDLGIEPEAKISQNDWFDIKMLAEEAVKNIERQLAVRPTKTKERVLEANLRRVKMLQELEVGKSLQDVYFDIDPQNEFVYKVTVFPGQEEHEYNLLSWYEKAPDWLNETAAQIAAERTNGRVTKLSFGRLVQWDTPNGPEKYTFLDDHTGQYTYGALVDILGSKRAASEALNSKGVDGITFPAESLRTGSKTPEKGNRNFVIFNEDNIRIEEARAYEQNLEFFQSEGPRTPPPKAVKSGHTIPVYHQTRATFDIFDKDRAMGASNARSGPGFYFSNDPGDTAGSYGGKVMPMWIKLKNPLRISEKDRTSVYSGMSEAQVKAATQATISEREETVLEQLLDGTIEPWAGGSQYHIKTKTRGSATGFFPSEVFKSLGIEDGVKLTRKDAERVADFIELGKIPSDFGVSKTEQKRGWVAQQKGTQKVLKEMGYDGVIHEQDDGRLHYVVFDSAQAKHEDATSFDPEDPNIFHQKGRTLKSGSQTIRGKTQFQADGKFVVDLFKSGDVMTLAHEFAHVFSPHMDQKMIDAMIDRVTSLEHNIDMLGKSKASITQTKVYMRGLWKSFQAMGARHPRFQNKEGKDWQYLVAIQEELASQFETYLGTRTAPTAEFVPVFKEMALKYREYYGAIRKLPVEQQRVHHDIATLFDDMIAGEKALPRVQPRKITVDGDTMTLHLSRPKEAARRKLLKALNRVDADLAGLKEHIQEYLNEVFTIKKVNKKGVETEKIVIPDALKLALELVEDNKQGLALMKKIDAALAKQELFEKRSVIKEIKDKTKDTILKDMDKSIADMIRKTIAHLDVGTRSEKSIRGKLELQKAIKDRLLNNKDISSEDLLSEESDLKKIADMSNVSIYSLTLDEVKTIRDAIQDLIRYDDVRAEQHIKREIAMQNERHTSFSGANRKTWQWNTRNKDRALVVEKLGSAFRKYVASSLESPSRILEGLHEQGDRLYKELTAGRVKQQATDQSIKDALTDIFSGTDLTGVSNSLGPVSKDQKVQIKMYNQEGTQVQLDLTLGQLMYMYGVSYNVDGLRHLLIGGIKRPKGTGVKKGDEQDVFKFRSPEEMYTAFDNIPVELRQSVVDVMALYRNTVAPLINETSRDLLGVDIATIENYLPLAVEGHARGDKRVLHLSQLGQKGRSFALEQIEHAKFLQSRKGGSAPLYAVDLFDMVDRNITDVASYVGMARPVRSATALLQPGADGSVSGELARMLGQKRADHLWEWIQDEEDSSRKSSGFDRWINKQSSRVRRGILKLNISVSMSQIVSLNNIQNYLTEGGGKLDLLSSILTANGRPVLAKYTREQMAAMHPTLRDRFEHIPEVGLEGSNENIRTQQRFGKHGGLAGRIVGHALQTGEHGLWAIKRMDAWAISKTIETMEKQQKRHGWSDEEMMERTMHIINRTQPTSDPLHTSRFLGQPSSGAKKLIFGVFQSARDNIRGEVQTSVQDLRKAYYLGDKKGMRAAAHKINRVVVTSSALVALIQTGVRRMMDQDDEDESFFLDWAVQTLNNIVGLVPFAGNMVQGIIAVNLDRYRNDTNAPLLSQFDDFIDTLKVPDDDDELMPWAYDVMKESAGLVGSGWKNVARQTEKVMKED